MVLEGFETPFAQKLDDTNRWVVLAKRIPWDLLSNIYLKQLGVSSTGRPPISPRIVIGSLIIKHMCNLDDRETVAQITENMYMQYFLGYSSFTTEAPFDPSLFVEFRERLGIDQLNAINEKIVELSRTRENKDPSPPSDPSGSVGSSESKYAVPIAEAGDIKHQGRVIMDATACPQDIAYPTDLNLLAEAREKSEQLIDLLYNPLLADKKPRTYRKIAHKQYLQTAQKKIKHKKVNGRAIRKQLGYLHRNLKSIDKLLDKHQRFPLKAKEQKCLMVLHLLYEQQAGMFKTKSHTVADRIVSIHQPHVRPIVRGKTTAHVEFGAKIQVSLVDGFAFLDDLSWDAFNEGVRLMDYIERYRKRFGYYPKEVLADKIYCNRENRGKLKELE